MNFSENITIGDSYDNITLTSSDGAVVRICKKVENNKLILKPNDALEKNTKYNVLISKEAIKDMAGNILKNDFNMSFTTNTLDVNNHGNADIEK